MVDGSAGAGDQARQLADLEARLGGLPRGGSGYSGGIAALPSIREGLTAAGEGTVTALNRVAPGLGDRTAGLSSFLGYLSPASDVAGALSGSDIFSQGIMAGDPSKMVAGGSELLGNLGAALLPGSYAPLDPAMFIGVFGAKNLGKGVADNLKKAKIMEKKADPTIHLGGSQRTPEESLDLPSYAARKDPVLNETMRTNYGWHKNPADNLWRLEIHTAENFKFKSKKQGEFEPENVNDGRYRYINPKIKAPLRWSDWLSFPELEKAYPAIKDIHLDITIERGRKVAKGSHRPAFQKAPAKIMVRGAPEDIKSAILHELQHFIQYQEGFAKGSGLRWGKTLKERFMSGDKEVEKWFKDAKVELRQLAKEHLETAKHMEERLPTAKDPKKTLADKKRIQTLREDAEKIEDILTLSDKYPLDKDAYEQEMNTLSTWVYAKHAGEVEARVVQERMDFTPQQRLETPPTEGRHLGRKTIPYTGEARRFLERLEIPEQIVDLVGLTRRAHGGPIYASEILHMQNGGASKRGPVEKVARGVLGPAYEPLAALPGLLGEISPGADVRDYQEYTSKAIKDALKGEYGQAGTEALWGLASLAGVLVPGSVSKLDPRKLAKKEKPDLTDPKNPPTSPPDPNDLGAWNWDKKDKKWFFKHEVKPKYKDPIEKIFGPQEQISEKIAVAWKSVQDNPGPDIFDFKSMRPARAYAPDAAFPVPGRAKGFPDWMKEQQNPAKAKAVKNAIQRARKAYKRGDLFDDPSEWYFLGELHDNFRKELGKKKGDANFRKLVEYIGATTSKSNPSANFRAGTYYYWLDLNKLPAPLGEATPRPYAGLTSRTTHQPTAATVRREGANVLDVNPKPAHFAQDLGGNLEVPTIDEVISGPNLLDIRTGTGKPAGMPQTGTYGYWRDYFTSITNRMGGKPAQRQSEAWVGSQAAERMAQYSKSALRIFQERIKVTARVLGISDKKALSGFIKGKWPLLEVGAVAGAGVGLAAAGTDALLADQKEYAAGGPVYAGEALHMQNGGPLSTMISIQPKSPDVDESIEEPVSAAWDAFRYSGTRDDVLRRREILKSFESEKLLEEGLLRKARTDPVHREMANTEYTMPYWPDIIKDPVTALAWDPDKISSIPGSDPGFYFKNWNIPGAEGWYDRRTEKIGVHPKFGVMEEKYRMKGGPEPKRYAFEMGKRVLLHELTHKGLSDLKSLMMSRRVDEWKEQENKTYESPVEELAAENRTLEAERNHQVTEILAPFSKGQRSDEFGHPFTHEEVTRLQDLRRSAGWETLQPEEFKDVETWAAKFSGDSKMFLDTLNWLDGRYPRPEWLHSDERAEALSKVQERYTHAQDLARAEITKRWPGWNYQMPEESVYRVPFNAEQIFQDRYGYGLPGRRTDDQLSLEQAWKAEEQEGIRSLPPHPSGRIPKPPGLILEPAGSYITPQQPDFPGGAPGAAHGGPIHASEGGEGPQDIFRPTTVTLPPLLKLFEDIKIRHEEVPQSRPSVKRFPGDPPPPPTGSPIIEESFGFPLGPAQGTVFRTRVPKRAVGTTPSGAVMRDSEELGVRVEGLPVARVGPVSVALNIDLFKTKEGISGPGIKHTIGSQLKRFGIIGQGEDFRIHFDRTTTDVKGGPSQTEHSGSLVVNVLRDEKFGTADVYVNANELEGKLEGSVGIRGGFKFAEGGLASMAPEARGMFGKPHPMTKEPRLTDLGPGTNPGVASLCGVARNMNRSVVA